MVVLNTVTVAALAIGARWAPNREAPARYLLAGAQILNGAGCALFYLYPVVASVRLPAAPLADWLFLSSDAVSRGGAGVDGASAWGRPCRAAGLGDSDGGRGGGAVGGLAPDWCRRSRVGSVGPVGDHGRSGDGSAAAGHRRAVGVAGGALAPGGADDRVAGAAADRRRDLQSAGVGRLVPTRRCRLRVVATVICGAERGGTVSGQRERCPLGAVLVAVRDGGRWGAAVTPGCC